MKAYCINCGSIQPSKFRPGQDAITNESYEDLCCDTCHFIVATIQDRESSQQPSQALELSQQEAEALAHRRASKYAHRSDSSYVAYTFLPHTLMDFVRDVTAAINAKEQPNG